MVLGTCLGLAACSPTYNWRSVVHEGVPLQALMPCKPEQAQREVPLLGADMGRQTLQMLGCEAGGATFALAAVALPDTAGLSGEEALQRWVKASWAGLKLQVPAGQTAPAGWAMAPMKVVGAESVQYWRGPAADHRQRAVQARVLWTTQGRWVVQAAVYAERPDDDAVNTYFDALRWTP